MSSAQVLPLAREGLRLFPVLAKGKTPLVEDWPNQASSRDERIRFWEKRWPGCNWGVACGNGSGIFILDFDGEQGLAVLGEWMKHYGPEFTETRGVKTARGGHLWFRWPEGETRIRNSAGKIAPGVDVRGEGGYVIVPPSIHPDGLSYTWAGDPHTPIAEAPSWLVALILSVAGPKSTASVNLGNGNGAAAGMITQGQRNATLASFAGTLRRRGMSQQALEAVLLAENAAHCNPPLPEAEVREIAASIGRYEPARAAESPATSISSSAWPEPLTPQAFHGLAGEIVRIIEPHSEADPAALLIQFLIAFGNAVGRGPYFLVESTRHFINLFACLVGMTAKARKGTSWNRVRELFVESDPEWVEKRFTSGLSSGEGLIAAVRDPEAEDEAVNDSRRGRGKAKKDGGVTDKRLMVVQGEFCSVLKVMEREGNTLSTIIRDAFDSGNLNTMTKTPMRATDAHISIVGHITRDELRSHLTETDKANGFANRFLWLCVKRSKILPEGGEVPRLAIRDFIDKLNPIIVRARAAGRLQRDDEAKELWATVYPNLSEGQLGLFGFVTARAEALVVRLSCIHALLDGTAVVAAKHLQAALAVWKYCEDSARYIFGDALGDPVADAILAAIKESTEGLTRTHLSDLFGRHKSAARIETALTLLQERGKVARRTEPTEGRSVEIWFAVGRAKEAK